MLKRCPDCKKLWEKYSKNKSNRCLLCRRIWDKNWRKKRKESGNPVISIKMPRSYHRRYEKEYSSRPGVKKHRAELMRSYAKDPKLRPKHQARWALNKALKSGKIKKSPCFCGNKKVQAHHEDYSKPLKVKWFCKKHHPKAEGGE